MAKDWLDDVMKEHKAQVKAGYTSAHDDAHVAGELSAAANTYKNVGTSIESRIGPSGKPLFWPWEAEAYKPKDRYRNLIRSIALSIAERDRITRATKNGDSVPADLSNRAERVLNQALEAIKAYVLEEENKK